jgi:hypothetical protein
MSSRDEQHLGGVLVHTSNYATELEISFRFSIYDQSDSATYSCLLFIIIIIIIIIIASRIKQLSRHYK